MEGLIKERTNINLGHVKNLNNLVRTIANKCIDKKMVVANEK